MNPQNDFPINSVSRFYASGHLRSAGLLMLGAGGLWLIALMNRQPLIGIAAFLVYGAGMVLAWNCFSPQKTASIQQQWLFRLTRWSLLVLLLFMCVPSSDPQVLGYYGSVWIFIIAAQIGETLFIITLALRPPRLSIPVNYLWLLLVVLIGGFCVVLSLVTLFQGQPKNILAAIWLVGLFPALLWVAYAAPTHFDSAIVSTARLWFLCCGVLIVAGIGVSLLSLRAFPSFMNTDEPWTLSYADTTNRTGQIYASMFPDGQIPVRSSPRIYYLLNSWMDLSGQRDIYSARAFSMLAGMLLLPVIFVAARTLYDSTTALIAVLLLATSIMWMATSHVARPEMWLTLAIWSGVALLALAQRRNSALLAFAGGLVLALSTELHLFGVMYCLIIGIWRLSLVRSWRTERMQIIMLIGGGICGALIFASYHLLPDPQAFILGFNNERGISSDKIAELLVRRYEPYFNANPVEFIFLIGASLYAVIVAREPARMGLIALLCFVVYAVVITDSNMYYPMVWLPSLILLTAYTIRSMKWSTQVVMAVLLISIACVTFLRVREHVVADWNDQALRALEAAGAHIPTDGTVVGQALLYLGLRNEQFISYAYVISHYPEDDGLSGLPVIRPCYLITHDQDWIFNDAPQILSSGVFIDLPGPNSKFQSAYHVFDTIETELGTFRIWQRNAACSS